MIADVNAKGADAARSKLAAPGVDVRAFVSGNSTRYGCLALIENVIANKGRINGQCNSTGVTADGRFCR